MSLPSACYTCAFATEKKRSESSSSRTSRLAKLASNACSALATRGSAAISFFPHARQKTAMRPRRQSAQPLTKAAIKAAIQANDLASVGLRVVTFPSATQTPREAVADAGVRGDVDRIFNGHLLKELRPGGRAFGPRERHPACEEESRLPRVDTQRASARSCRSAFARQASRRSQQARVSCQSLHRPGRGWGWCRSRKCGYRAP